jgi:hypothetical protein
MMDPEFVGASSTILRGTKPIKLSLFNNKLFFLDSLNHLPGSLAKLAKDFNVGETKGYFPHTFNTPENQNYVGPLPPKSFYCQAFSAKNEADINAFEEWYASQPADLVWNFQEELHKYNMQDVALLCRIMKEYHDTLTNTSSFHSPWFKSTAPGYAHERTIFELKSQIDPFPDGKDRDELERYCETETANGWAKIRSREYFGIRKALSGGRTDVRHLYHQVTPEDAAAGRYIVAVDVVSLYPACQVLFDYPVGPPTIYVFNPDYIPCTTHSQPEAGNVINNFGCQCPIPERLADCENDLLTIQDRTTVTSTSISNYFGVIHAHVTAPTSIIHPVLGIHRNHKFIFPTGSFSGAWTSVELERAISRGYTINKIHIVYHFKRQPGLWKDFIFKMVVEKVRNSKPPRSVEDTYNAYANKFPHEETFLTSLKEALQTAELRPAARQVYKIILNSLWGKHCERPVLRETTILPNNGNNPEANLEAQELHERIIMRQSHVKDLSVFGTHHIISTEHNTRGPVPITFGRTYLPTGLFVPAYGRLILEEQLHLLGKRVLYHDTDSIYYIYDPTQYNIPQSSTLGDWEEEDLSKERIIEFVAAGPKSYGIKTATGKEFVKVKGLSLKYAHKNMLNFDIMKSLVLNPSPTPLLIPQFTLRTPKVGGFTFTDHFFKKFSHQRDTLKGTVDPEDLYLAPFILNE